MQRFAATCRIRIGRILLCCSVVLCLAGCATPWRYEPPQVLPDDRQDIPEPEPRGTTLGQDTFEYAVKIPTRRFFDLARHIRSLSGNRIQALNVDAFDDVQDSSWFTHRNDKHRMSLEEISRGPNVSGGPETEGPWKIDSAKVEGFTPGFNIIDARGDKYVIKFDPWGFRELGSAAEVISTLLFHAAGFNVPENYIVIFNPEILKMDDACLLVDEKGIICEMTANDFDKIMQKVEPLPDGRVRAVASKFLKGEKILGGFRYLGTRDDDPNDIVPHEHRRELRGLYVMCAWLKHLDIKDSNSLDVYIDEDGRRYIKHYLIDFGSTLGSTVEGPMLPFRGHETEFDTPRAFSNLFTLGLNVREWEKAPDIIYPSIGRYSTWGYDPGKTAMNFTNPAFSFRTDLDGYWGAKLVMSFTDDQLAVVVRQGQYSDPNAEFHLLEVLKARRDMTGRYWFGRVNCLDRFTLSELAEGSYELRFEDLGVEYNLWTKKQTRYRYDFRINDQFIKEGVVLSDQTAIHIDKLENFLQESPRVKRRLGPNDQWEVSLEISRDYGQNWGRWVKVYFRKDPSTGHFTLMGVKRKG